MARLVCDLCGYELPVTEEAAMEAQEIPKHCGQTMNIVNE